MTIFTRWICALALGFALVGPVTAAPAESAQVLAEVDWKSFDRVGNHARIWLLRSLPETTMLGHDLYPHRSQRIQYVIDCTDASYALSQWILTDGEDGSGAVVWADRNEALAFVTAHKGTLEAGVVHAACALEPTATKVVERRHLFQDSSPLSN
jgi:hypothetical protein